MGALSSAAAKDGKLNLPFHGDELNRLRSEDSLTVWEAATAGCRTRPESEKEVTLCRVTSTN
jgi:hypothetical protein